MGILTGVFSLFSGIFGIFSKHHAQAVKTEAAALNEAVPATLQTWVQIMDAVNGGQISAQDAITTFQQSMTAYEEVVYKQYKVKKKECNGPCVIEQTLKRSLDKIIALIQSGEAGDVIVEKTFANAGYQGTSAFPLHYNGGSVLPSFAAPLTQSVSIGTMKFPLWVLLVVAGFALWFVYQGRARA